MPTTQTPQRLQLGRALRSWRERQGLSRDAVAEALACPVPKVGKIETGHATVSPLELRTLIALFEVPDGAEADKIVALADQARRRPQRRVPEWLRAYVSLEAEAVEIKLFHIDLIPGMFQTEEYIRAITKPHDPAMSPEEVDHLVATRREWQARLRGADAPRLSVVLHEAAIRTLVGSEAVMREQLTQVLELAELPNVSVQVLPYRAGAHPSMGTSFITLRLPPPAGSEVVYMEDLWSAEYVERPEQVSAYRVVFDRLCASALDEHGSRAAIKEVIRELS